MKNIKKLMICLVLCGLLNNKVFPAFQFTEVSARVNGLSGAFVALADDASAITINPAGLRQVLVKNISFSYMFPYIGLPLGNLSLMSLNYVHPIRSLGSFGISYFNYAALNIYKESIFYLAYAAKLNDFFEDLLSEIYTGLTIKIFSHTYNWDDEMKSIAEYLDDPVFKKGNSASAISLDIGSIIRLGRLVYWGFSFNNMIPANVGIYYEDIIPTNIKTGISFRKPFEENEVFEKMNISCDISYRNQTWGELSDRLNFMSSIELFFKKIKVILRTGLSFDSFSLGVTYSKDISKLKNMNLDIHYSFSLPFRLADNYGTHNISLAYNFGNPVLEKKKEIIEEKIKIKEELLEEIFKEESPSQPSQQELKKDILQPTTSQMEQEGKTLQKQETEIKQNLLQDTTSQQQIEDKKKTKPSKKTDVKQQDNVEEEIMKKLLELEKEGDKQ